MSGHLCLKWNNHSAAFQNSFSDIRIKEKFCDATIVCQGKVFPVHRVVLCTCSEYFDEIFGRIHCQNPYIIFKDIEEQEMELLLNYMYQGEVNVSQENLPLLIKAAEILKIKGLSVPDEIHSSTGGDLSLGSLQQPSSKLNDKKGNDDLEQDKKMETVNIQEPLSSDYTKENIKIKVKEEPVDTVGIQNPCFVNEGQLSGEKDLVGTHSVREDSSCSKEEIGIPSRTFEGSVFEGESFQTSPWVDFGTAADIQNAPSMEMGFRGNIYDTDHNSESIFNSQLSLNSTTFLQHQKYEGTIAYPIQRGKRLHFRSQCSYKSNSKLNVLTHINSKHRREKGHPCQFCSSKFMTNSDLKRHLLIHTGEKPFQCSSCTKRFTQKSSLRRHLESKKGCMI